MKLRCSSLPLISVCAQAAHAPEVPIIGPKDAADLGSAVHMPLANLVETGLPAQQSELAAAADQWQVDLKELTVLYRMGAALWNQVKQFFPSARAEVELSDARDGFILVGHADAMALVGSEVRIADHKSGRLDYDATAQLMGYALLGLTGNECATAWACILRIRDGERIAARWTRDELESWWARLVAHLKADAYTPGTHCRYCPRFHECPAGAAHVRQLGDMILVDDATAMQLTPARAIALLDRVKLLEKVCEAMRTAIKTTVASEGGEWTDTDGNTLRINRQEQKEILYANGAAILSDVLGDRLPEVIRISKTKVEEIVKENAPRGHKSLAVQGIMDRLTEADAINIKVVERLEAKAAPKMLGAMQ